MSKRYALSLALIAGLGLAAAASAQDASQGSRPAMQDSAQGSSDAQAAQRSVSSEDQKQDEVEKPDCLRETGSLIKPEKGQCLSVSGRSYSQKDLRSTGQPDIARALQQLDPSVTVHGH